MPGDSFLLHALALEYQAAGDAALAIDTFEQLLQAQPDYIGSYYHLAGLYAAAGRRELSEQTYRTGMERAMLAGEQRTYRELQSALNLLLEEDAL